jgi:hypothetical protein
MQHVYFNLCFRLLYKWWNTFKIKAGLQAEDKENGKIKNQWTEDYKLLDWGPRGLFPEYLEMSKFFIPFTCHLYAGIFVCTYSGQFVQLKNCCYCCLECLLATMETSEVT